MILIKNGRIIDPKTKRDDVLDIVIDGGKIVDIGKYGRNDDYEYIIEATGYVVAPGFVDVHTHFRDPGFPEKEDIYTGAKAAAHGGFTSVVMMANTNPPIDCPEVLDQVLDKGKETGIHVYSVACISKGMAGKELTDMEALKEHGAVGFSDDGKPIESMELMLEAIRKAKALNAPLSLHEEAAELIGVAGINDGPIAKKLGIEKGAPALSEDIMVARDCMLAVSTGAPVHFQHISSMNAVRQIELAKSMGAHVTAEVTPHHFTLTEEAVETYGTMAKMNPPVRSVRDRFEVLNGLKRGVIDMIATDHAPHTAEEKEKPFPQAPSGIIGLETALGLAECYLIRKGHITLTKLIELLSWAPAKLYGLDAGYLAPGGPADLVIFSEQEPWEVKDLMSRSQNTPFLGQTLYAKVKYTICDGQIVYSDSELHPNRPSEFGDGREK